MASQGERAHELLVDPERSAVLVTLPEETPVNETIETAYELEDDPGIRLAASSSTGRSRSIRFPGRSPSIRATDC